MIAPCYHCPDRSPGCHSECERYRAYRAEHEEIRKKRAEEFKVDAAFAERGDKIRRDASRWAKKVRGK